MIRNVSEPVDKEIYGDYKWLVNALYIASLAGSAYSGMTEWNGFKSDELSKVFPILYPVIGIALIESMRIIAPALFLTMSRMIKKSDTRKKKYDARRIPVLIVLTGLVVALTALSIGKSEDGIEYKAEEDYQFDDNYVVDSSKYKMLIASCNSTYYSDSLSAATKAKSNFGEELKRQKNKKKVANTRISQVKHLKAQWAVNTVAQMSNIAQVALGNIKSLNQEINIAIQDSLNVSKSKFNACIANANDTLRYYTNKAEIKHNKAKIKNDQDKDKKVNRNYFLMCLGVIFILIHAVARQWLYHVSGVVVTYKFNATDKGVSFWDKANAILKVHLQNLGNFILGVLSFGYELSVNNDELDIKERNRERKSGAKWWQFIKRKREKLQQEQELKRTEEREAYQIRQAEIEAEKFRIIQEAELRKQQAEAERLKQQAEIEKAKAETIRIKQQAEQAELERKQAIRLAEIAANKKRDELKAQQEHEINLAKAKASIALQQEKERLQQEAEKLRLQQEKLQQEKLQQEQERQLQQEQERLQQAEKARKNKERLAHEATLLAQRAEAERIKKQQQEQQLKQDMEKLKAQNDTINEAQLSVNQQDINKLFEACFDNGVLVDSRKFKGNIKNYYTRWHDATEKLKSVRTEKRKQQILRGLNNNKIKYQLSVEKAKAYNITIKNGMIG